MAEETKTTETENEAVEPAVAVTEDATPAAEEPVEVVEVKKVEDLKPGMVVRVHQKIKEHNTKGEERERIQIFEGNIIAVKGKDARSRTITVRKISLGVGVERIFPVLSTAIAKFEVVKRYAVRRAKLYYTRSTNKSAKLKKVMVEKKKA